MKKIANVRYIVVAALAMCLGVVFARRLYKIDQLFIVLGGLSLSFLSIGIRLLVKKYKVIFTTLAVAVVFTFIALIIGDIAFIRASTHQAFCDVTYQIEGVICSINRMDEAYRVIIDKAIYGGQALDGKLYAYVDFGAGEAMKIGDRICFYTSLERVDIDAYGYISSNSISGVKYRCYVFGGVTVQPSFDIFLTVRQAINEIIYAAMDYDNASLASALIIGETFDVDEELYSIFQYNGISHIFSVSGMHIAILYGALNAVLKHLPINKYVKTIGLMLFVTYYAGICNFSSPSVRSVIMCGVANSATLFQQKYDKYNSLAISAIILIFINPLYIFHIGFILSFLAVFGMFLLTSSIQRRLFFLPKTLRSPLAVSIAATLGTLPVLMTSFGYVSIASVIFNLICSPFITVLYVLMTVGVFINLLLPFIPVVLTTIASMPFMLFISALVALNFKGMLFTTLGLGTLILGYYAVMVGLSQLLNIKLRTRIITNTLIAILSISYLFGTTFLPMGGTYVTVNSSQSTNIVVLSSGVQSVLVINEDYFSYYVKSAITKYCLAPPKAIILLGDKLSVTAVYQIKGLSKSYYLSPHSIQVEQASVYYKQTFIINQMTFTYIDSNTLNVWINGVDVQISIDEQLTYTQADLLIGKQENFICDFKYECYFDQIPYKLNCYDQGDLKFLIDNGKIKLIQGDENEIH